MSYHDLSECTLSDDERLDEAKRIAQMLEGDDTIMKLSEKEYSLVRKMKNANFCSTKQLFFLRDIKDRVL